MALNYKAFQSNLETKDGKKLWYPTLVKEGDTDTAKIADRIAEKSSLTRGDVYNVIDCMISELNDKLMNGHSVNLEGLGTFRAIISAKGNGVETPQEVNSAQIKSLRIIFTPTAKRTPFQGVTRALYAGVEFRRWAGDPYNPKNQTDGSNTDGGNGGNGGNWQDPDS